jgi:hypothetical protein
MLTSTYIAFLLAAVLRSYTEIEKDNTKLEFIIGTSRKFKPTAVC